MLKKGQTGWIDNAHPVLEGWCNEERDMVVRWPSKKPRRKKYGIRIQYISWGSRRVVWKHWYVTQRDRSNAIAHFKKQPWAEKRLYDLMERE